RAGPHASYLDLAVGPGRARLDRALDRFLSLAAEAREYWAGFPARVAEALEAEFEEEVPVTVRVKRPVARRLLEDPEVLADALSALLGQGPAAAPAARAKAERVKEKFPTPAGLGWDKVTIRLISDRTFRAEAGGIGRPYTFADLGCEDR